jgi:membrane protease YdiL (CAAX protease family)
MAKYWIGHALDYSWFQGRWSLKMWLWLPLGFVLGFGFMWFYFNILTPTLHHSWPLPLEGDRTGAMWRLFWGCNFIGVWDELAFINLVFVLLARHFRFGEANLAQAVFFTSFLHEMAFVGWGPVVIYGFALIQGYTYRKTGSLFYIVILHLMIDSILFYMIANRWYPGWGWHPW